MLCPNLNNNSSRILKLYTLDKSTSNMYNGIITITLVLYNVQVQKNKRRYFRCQRKLLV